VIAGADVVLRTPERVREWESRTEVSASIAHGVCDIRVTERGLKEGSDG
jgi:hypothetical protein